MPTSPLLRRTPGRHPGPALALGIVAVILVLSALTPLGCGRPGLGGPETPGRPKLLWAWPSESEAKTAPGLGNIAFFRFQSPVTPGSLYFTVEPQTDATLTYASPTRRVPAARKRTWLPFSARTPSTAAS